MEKFYMDVYFTAILTIYVYLFYFNYLYLLFYHCNTYVVYFILILKKKIKNLKSLTSLSFLSEKIAPVKQFTFKNKANWQRKLPPLDPNRQHHYP